MATEPNFTIPSASTQKSKAEESISGSTVSKNSARQPLKTQTILNLPRDVPLIFLVGPQGVGKTAALTSLIDYTTNTLGGNLPVDHVVAWSPYTELHSEINDGYKEDANNLLLKLSDVQEYIGSTGDYFVLNGKRKGRAAFFFIEAPGEDYFPRAISTTDGVKRGGKLFAPLYLANIVQSEQKKIYIFVFNPAMFKGQTGERAHLEAYDKAVGDFISKRITNNRDKFLLLYTNVKEDPVLPTGRSEEEVAKIAFSAGGRFHQTGEAFRNSPIKDKQIIPYDSCEFVVDENGKQGRTHAEAKYPRRLMAQLVIFLRGRKWYDIFSIK